MNSDPFVVIVLKCYLHDVYLLCKSKRYIKKIDIAEITTQQK